MWVLLKSNRKVGTVRKAKSESSVSKSGTRPNTQGTEFGKVRKC